MTAQPWRPDEDATLRELWAAGVRKAEIGIALQRSWQSIAGRLHRLGLEGAPRRPWTPEDAAKLDALLERHLPYAKIAKRLKRSVIAVKHYAKETLHVTLLTAGGYTQPGFARLFGVHKATVEHWVRTGHLTVVRSGLAHPKVLISDADVEAFIANERAWHLWDPSLITERATREWAIEARHGVTFLTVREAAQSLCLTEAAVHRRLRLGQLPGVKRRGCWFIRSDQLDAQTPRSRKGERPRRWTATELDYVRAVRAEQSLYAIARALNRPMSSVSVLVRRLGLAGSAEGLQVRA